MDYERHNEKVERIWQSYHSGQPEKVPVILYYDARIWLGQQGENPKRITLPEYIQDKDLMLECQVRAQEYKRLNILSDEPMGYPYEEGYSIIVDFQNYFEIAWLGGEVQYSAEPHARSFLHDDNKYSIFDNPPPDAFSGIGEKAMQYYDYFVTKCKSYLYEGIPVKNIALPFNMAGTDGPFTVACGIRGTENFIEDLVLDIEYAHRLLDYITTSIIGRIKQVRKYLGHNIKSKIFGIGDDAVELISPAMYESIVLPYHKRIYNELCEQEGERHIHLCGNAQHLFKTIQNHLGIECFDTGFPINFELLYDQLDPETRINGGPSVILMQSGDKRQIIADTERILKSGIMDKSKKFVLRDANAICPGTKLSNINALYEACEQYGYY